MQNLAVIGRGSVSRQGAPLLGRLFTKLVVDVLPAALASLIGGFLFSQYQHGHWLAPRPAAQQVAPASAEMMQLVRDEHAMILDYLKAQTAAEKSRYAIEDKEDARAAADAKTAPATMTRRVPGPAASPAVVPPSPMVSHVRTAVTVSAPPLTVQAPRVIIQAEQSSSAAPAAEAQHPSDSLLAKTITIKDHVVHAALHAVSAIGGIPNWIASLGDRFGGASPNPPSANRLAIAS